MLNTTPYGKSLCQRLNFSVLGCGLLLSWCISEATLAVDITFDIIPLKHRPADMLQPQIQALAGPNTIVTAADQQLIIRGPREDASLLASLISELDTPLTQLMVFVRQGTSNSRQRETHHLDTQLSSSADSIKKTQEKHSTTLTIRGTTRSFGVNSQDTTTQQLRVIEGHPAFIQTGKDIPFAQQHLHGRHQSYTQQNYKAVNTGFYVTPRLVGNGQVAIDISTQQQSSDGKTSSPTILTAPSVSTLETMSTLQVDLGEWVTIGANEQQRTKTASQGGRHFSTAAQDTQIQIRVVKAQ